MGRAPRWFRGTGLKARSAGSSRGYGGGGGGSRVPGVLGARGGTAGERMSSGR